MPRPYNRNCNMRTYDSVKNLRIQTSMNTMSVSHLSMIISVTLSKGFINATDFDPIEIIQPVSLTAT